MNIIEKGPQQRIQFLEKIRQKAGKTWWWLVGTVLSLLLVLTFCLFYYKILRLSFAPHDFFFIGIFILAAVYCLLQLKQFK